MTGTPEVFLQAFVECHWCRICFFVAFEVLASRVIVFRIGGEVENRFGTRGNRRAVRQRQNADDLGSNDTRMDAVGGDVFFFEMSGEFHRPGKDE